MALVQFTSVAGAPFIMFEESAKKVFSEIGETWTPEGGFPPEDLDGVLARREEARERDKERHRRDKEALEKKVRECSYEELDRLKDEQVEEKFDKRVNLFQLVEPLIRLVERARDKGEAVTWGRP